MRDDPSSSDKEPDHAMDRWRTWSPRKSLRFMTWRKSAEPLFSLSTFPWGKLSTLDAEYSTVLREMNVSVLFNQKTQRGTFKICLKPFKYVQSCLHCSCIKPDLQKWVRLQTVTQVTSSSSSCCYFEGNKSSDYAAQAGDAAQPFIHNITAQFM